MAIELFDLRVLVRKLVLAGFPLLAACADGGSGHYDFQNGECVGGWGPEAPQSCQGSFETYNLVDPTDDRVVAAYRRCAAQGSCDHLCLLAIPSGGGSPTTLDHCLPACKPPGYIGVRAVWNASCGVAIGRRPEGLAPAAGGAVGTVGEYFAEIARLEGASVPAFARLAREMDAHGAPPALAAACRRSMRDEVRHFHVTRALARRFGAEPPPPAEAPLTVRPFAEVAMDNAREGCVRETCGALVARWQARAAGDPAVRAAMIGIAIDETRHARLSWTIDAWIATRAGRALASRLDEARGAALGDLGREMAAETDPGLAAAAGLPSATSAMALVDRLSEAATLSSHASRHPRPRCRAALRALASPA